MGLLIPLLVWSTLVIPAQRSADRVRDVRGAAVSLFAPAGMANVLVFVSSDCPIANGYAPDIQKLCSAYARRGVACTLIYEDAAIEPAAVQRHLTEFRYRDVRAVIDRDRSIAARARASVTPQAVVVDAAGTLRYRGRIDNRYAAFGKARRVVTAHELRDALDAVLSGTAVANPETAALGCFIPSR